MSSLDMLRQIKEAGVAAATASVDALLDTEEGALGFQYLIAKAKSREELALSKLAPEFRPGPGEPIDLNDIVARIDAQYGFNELLAGGAIERYIQNQGYILEPKGSKKEQNKNSDELNESLVTVLSTKQQQEIISAIGDKFINQIIGNLTAKAGSQFISSARIVILGASSNFFYDLINQALISQGLNLNNTDLGSLQIKINTRGLNITQTRVNNFTAKIDPTTFSITSAGEFFNDMVPLAQQLLYATIKDEMENGTYLKDFVERYNSSKAIKYLQDLDVNSSMNLIRSALSSECSAALKAFDTYGKEIAYKGAKGNLRGGLGELRTLCILEAMFPGQVYSAAGLSKVVVGTSTEKESPVDAILTLLRDELDIGIQSKNTNKNIYSGWKVDKKEAMPMPSFYSQRLGEGLGGAEERFFNAYSYNQPVDKRGQYRSIWASMENNPAFIGKFNALVYRIIRQEVTDTSGVVYVNDFFFMNDKLVRSSDILTQIYANVKHHIASRSTSNKISSEYLSTSFDYSTNSNLVWNEETGWDALGNPIFAAGSANNVMINYSISLNINKMASMAISSFNP